MIDGESEVVLETRQGTQTVIARGDERLLYCGLEHEVDLAHECGVGLCGTCKATLLEGDVKDLWPEAPGNAYVKAERGEFLMCQAMADEYCRIKVRPSLRSPIPTATPQALIGLIENHQFLTPQIVTFELHLAQSIHVEAGQFATLLSLRFPGYRAYSMTHFNADRSNVLKFLVKKTPGGMFTDWLCSSNRDGALLQGFGPLGRAVFSPEIDGNFIALAGGSGIAGIRAVIQRAADCGHFDDHRATLVFGLNNADEVFWLDELNDFSKRYENLDVVIALVFEDGMNNLQQQYSELRFRQGFVYEVARTELDDLSDVSVAFLAGPPMSVDTCQKMLVSDKKFPVRKMRFDRFG